LLFKEGSFGHAMFAGKEKMIGSNFTHLACRNAKVSALLTAAPYNAYMMRIFDNLKVLDLRGSLSERTMVTDLQLDSIRKLFPNLEVRNNVNEYFADDELYG
jgi:hypothetical protein